MDHVETLINRCISEDEKAQERLYSKFAPALFGICMRFAKNRQEAEDILQEGFIKIFKNLKTFRNEGVLEAWMRRVIINTAINFYKKKIPNFQDIDFERWKNRQVRNEAIDNLSHTELLEAIQELPKGYRMVFNMNIIEGYTHKEISQKLDISVNTSKSQLSRARKVLQNKISKNLNRSLESDNLLPELLVS